MHVGALVGGDDFTAGAADMDGSLFVSFTCGIAGAVRSNDHVFEEPLSSRVVAIVDVSDGIRCRAEDGVVG